MRVLAELLRRVEGQTPYGGRSLSFEPVGSVWLKLGARRRLERGEGDQRRTVESLTAETRIDERLSVERVLRLGGADWDIVAIEVLRPGRASLSLERVR